MFKSEINQQIAELKGWKKVFISEYEFWVWYNESLKKVYSSELPNWRENISDAKELLDEMKQEFSIEISTDKNFTSIELWSDKESPLYYRMIFDAEAETLELAICLVYIAWKTT